MSESKNSLPQPALTGVQRKAIVDALARAIVAELQAPASSSSADTDHSAQDQPEDRRA